MPKQAVDTEFEKQQSTRERAVCRLFKVSLTFLGLGNMGEVDPFRHVQRIDCQKPEKMKAAADRFC